MQIDDFKFPSGTASFFRARGLMRFIRGMLVAKPYLVRKLPKVLDMRRTLPFGCFIKKRRLSVI